jgi:acyl carrier protein
MSYRTTIIENIVRVAKEQNRSVAPLADDLALQETGLDSLCWAIVVARLESELGFDPFTASDDVYFPVTLGDFVQAYDNGAS